MRIVYDDMLEFSEVVIRCHETRREDKCEYCPLYDRCEIDDPENRRIQVGEMKNEQRERVTRK